MWILVLLATPLALALLCILLAVIHRLGALKKLRHIHLVCGVVVIALVLAGGIYGTERYSLEHLPMSQPNTYWSTGDGSMLLTVSDTPGVVDGKYDYDLRVLIDGEYRAAELGTYGRPFPSIDVVLKDEPDEPVECVLSSGSWRMSGSGKLILRNGNERVVLERID